MTRNRTEGNWSQGEAGRRRVGRGQNAAPPRVLVVDDDVTSAALLEAMLTTAGMEVVIAEDGAIGRRLAGAAKPDVIIMDINMPGENGIEACRKLKQDASTDDIPVIFVTAVQDVASKVAGFRVGGSDYVTKPYEPEEVLARVDLQISLRRSEQTVTLQALALDEAKELIAIIDNDCKILFANKSCAVATGYPTQALVGRDMSVLVADTMPIEAYGKMRESILAGRGWTGELRMRRLDGFHSVFDATATSFPHKKEGVSSAVLVARDVTDSRMHQSELEHQARQDFLTGLVNRKGFVEMLAYLAEHRHSSTDELAVLYVDLDKFKLVNDTLGHTVGDALLVQAASRLKSCVRDRDMAARIGGDEFAVLLEGPSINIRAEAVAKRILESLDAPINVGGHELAVSASIGISIGSGSDWDGDSLIRDADTAMYAAKQSGRNRFISYSDSENAGAVVIAELRRDLILAAGRGEFEVHYQPIVETATMRITGAEALLRWNHPIKGLVSPGVFIPIAEEIGAINDIGDYVIRQACHAAVEWGEQSPLTVATNISATQLADPGFAQRVNQALHETGLDPGRLCLELSAQDLVRSGTAERIRSLRGLGVAIAVDHFRANTPAPEWLRRFSSAGVKVDGALLKEFSGDSCEGAGLKSIVQRAANSGLTATAEWVETPEQIDLVRATGFDFAQGYAISPPVSASAMRRLLEDEYWRCQRKEAA